ncbi:MAG: family transporter [Ferruginibacter sp.]|uniref:DMT family transporter n=1 Tax=Ferruginibacter sp. TaxID=1940288 RepID=UPI00265A609D|nr:DMT family transporter [Ferruginibacter sp.]MDB5275102.1 family transporter [Ferruginibacter sp.]
MNKTVINWLLLISLSLIWGSSFILMKIGLTQLSSYQVAAVRIAASGLILLPIALKCIKGIPAKKLLLIFLSGSIGSLIPAFLFCMAEEKVDSSLAGTLNALTPVFIIINGVIFFHTNTSVNKVTGIAIALSGSVLLLLSKGHLQAGQNSMSVVLIVLATFLYGFNVNMVSKKLLHIPSLHITAVALSLNAIPALLILVYTGYFKLPLQHTSMLISTSAAVVLGVGGTAIATIIFYMLVKRAGVIFASMVTYVIPFVAIAWGIIYGEYFGILQVICMVIILAGVYVTNKK